jgi:hypothetical protein
MRDVVKKRVVLCLVGVLVAASFGANCSGRSPKVTLPPVNTDSRDTLRSSSITAQSLANSLDRNSTEGDARDATVLYAALQETSIPSGVSISAVDESGVAEVFHDGYIVKGAVSGRVSHVQITQDDSGVCVRLSADGSRAKVNSNDPVDAGPYNEYVSPLDGVAGDGFAIVGYALGSSTSKPQSGKQNACDAVPMLRYDGVEWVVQNATDAW